MPVPATAATKLPIIEIFSSVQGEGILVGRRQIFLRLAGCNLNCDYCDTQFTATVQCQIEQPPGSEKFIAWSNPVGLEQIGCLLTHWLDRSPELLNSHHSISITGGEPLLHAPQLINWLPVLARLLPLQLETNGTLCDELAMLLPWLRWVIMDFKLESQTGTVTPWSEHRKFLALASQVNCCVKVVVGNNTDKAELEQVAQIVASTAAYVPVILQPRTVDNRCSVPAAKLLEWQALVANCNLDVRVIPQTHCYLAML
ncbi:MAG: hypothetical protein B6I36_09170 [Desulfobacteraceae bacterium 4572_35.1]|nr:MAG: hypothetical protein B6I36_09170 [Desulfobacteraceae bacterium 4572_35.1]